MLVVDTQLIYRLTSSKLAIFTIVKSIIYNALFEDINLLDPVSSLNAQGLNCIALGYLFNNMLLVLQEINFQRTRQSTKKQFSPSEIF